MYLCTACNEFSAFEYFDSYDDEIYKKCRICGKIQGESQPEPNPIESKKKCTERERGNYEHQRIT